MAQKLKDEETAREFQKLSPMEQLDVLQAFKDQPEIQEKVMEAALKKGKPSSLRSMLNPTTRGFITTKHPDVAIKMAKKHNIPLDA